GVRIVSMDFVCAGRRVGDRKDETFFAGNVREGFGHDFFYLRRWSGRSELRGDRTKSDCDGQDDLLHGDSQWFSSDLLFFQSLTGIRRQFVVYFCRHRGKFAGKDGGSVNTNSAAKPTRKTFC